MDPNTFAAIALVLWVLTGVFFALEVIESITDRREPPRSIAALYLRLLWLLCAALLTIVFWPVALPFRRP